MDAVLVEDAATSGEDAHGAAGLHAIEADRAEHHPQVSKHSGRKPSEKKPKETVTTKEKKRLNQGRNTTPNPPNRLTPTESNRKQNITGSQPPPATATRHEPVRPGGGEWSGNNRTSSTLIESTTHRQERRRRAQRGLVLQSPPKPPTAAADTTDLASNCRRHRQTLHRLRADSTVANSSSTPRSTSPDQHEVGMAA